MLIFTFSSNFSNSLLELANNSSIKACCQYTYTGSEVLKKYYHRLHQAFPSDHMITLGKLVQIGKVNDEAIDWISTAPTATIGNQRVLDFVILSIKGEETLLEFCDILEKLIEHPALLKLVESLRNGNYNSVFLILVTHTIMHYS